MNYDLNYEIWTFSKQWFKILVNHGSNKFYMIADATLTQGFAEIWNLVFIYLFIFNYQCVNEVGLWDHVALQIYIV